jgi:hypothetical protein
MILDQDGSWIWEFEERARLQSGRRGSFEKTRRSNRYFITYACFQNTGNRQARSKATSLVPDEEADSKEPLKML